MTAIVEAVEYIHFCVSVFNVWYVQTLKLLCGYTEREELARSKRSTRSCPSIGREPETRAGRLLRIGKGADEGEILDSADLTLNFFQFFKHNLATICLLNISLGKFLEKLTRLFQESSSVINFESWNVDFWTFVGLKVCVPFRFIIFIWIPT